ncbi:hypothetical protein OS190_15355 [Sulfitobacter sp. F26204]|nr:hypothetical protein [Sulfitobacter sp. F26204]MCX7560945.1 hypothetical protein [Sulfitobacter sp. F26204]
MSLRTIFCARLIGFWMPALVDAAQTMIDRTEERFGIKPDW